MVELRYIVVPIAARGMPVGGIEKSVDGIFGKFKT
jgi:hypothetical protein